MPAPVDFAAADLARHIEQLSQFELDRLPFGVILIDRAGNVLLYSQTEAQQSGYGKVPLGQNLFAVSNCMGSDDFRGRIQRALAQSPVDRQATTTIPTARYTSSYSRRARAACGSASRATPPARRRTPRH
jgi:PAS domain-containing protein